MTASSRRASKTMEHPGRHLNLRLTMVLLVSVVLLPVVLSAAVGIVSVAQSDTVSSLIKGILIISFTAAAICGVVLVIIILERRRRLVRLQADFVANVTHELRTPLTAIRMYAQTLLMGRLEGDKERTAESLETIVRESKWLEAIIDRVLTWRRVPSDRDDLHLTTGPLGDVLEEAVRHFEAMVPPGQVELTVDIDTTEPIPHDEAGVAMVLTNLLINAYKYSKAPAAIRLAARDEPDAAVIRVEDEGIGIAEWERERIFLPFYRADHDMVTAASGAGLGLAIVRHFVSAHGGTVTVDSVVGEGTTFTVRLPRTTEEKR